MKVLIIATGEVLDLDAPYAVRLIEQRQAVLAGDVPTSDVPAPVDYTQMGSDAAVLKAIAKTLAKTPEMIGAIAASGHADRIFNIGERIIIPWTDYSGNDPVEYQYPFFVVDIADCYDEEDVLHKNGIWLMAEYATPYGISFDYKETEVETGETFEAGKYYYIKNGSVMEDQTVEYGAAIPSGTTYYYNYKSGMGNAMSSGYNRWSMSAYRQWLNSSAAKNEGWWESQHVGDSAPTSQQTNKPGWLSGFSAEWLDIIKKVRIQTRCNAIVDEGAIDTTYDRFFLPSVEQMYGIPIIEAQGIEGRAWETFWKQRGMTEASNSSQDARTMYYINLPETATATVRLRTAGPNALSNGYIMDYKSINYISGSASVMQSGNAFPCCVLF